MYHGLLTLLLKGLEDKTIFVPPRSADERAQIFKLFFTGKPIEEIDYKQLAKYSHRYSAADIVAVCNLAIDKKIRIAMQSGKKELIGTKDIGTVRVGIGYFNEFNDIDKLVYALNDIQNS